jgi:hypothetical protein
VTGTAGNGVPKSVWSVRAGVRSPSTIVTELPVTLISGELTVTLKLQVAVWPFAAVTTYVLVVVPTGNAAPEARPAVRTVV